MRILAVFDSGFVEAINIPENEALIEITYEQCGGDVVSNLFNQNNKRGKTCFQGFIVHVLRILLFFFQFPMKFQFLKRK